MQKTFKAFFAYESGSDEEATNTAETAVRTAVGQAEGVSLNDVEKVFEPREISAEIDPEIVFSVEMVADDVDPRKSVNRELFSVDGFDHLTEA